MLSSKAKTSTWVTDLLYLSIILGIFYACWIGSYALFTPDEGRYSEVAREMVATGDYITPRLNGVAFLDKPILYYWLQASAIHMFGLKEWSLRFWPALLGIFGCLMTYYSGATLLNRRTGLLAAGMLATSPLYYGAAHYANLDLEVSVLISATLWFSLLGLQSDSNKSRFKYFFAAYFFAALATLTKGLIGIVFPTLVIGVWILLLNRWNFVKKMFIPTGLIFFSLLVIPWYFLVQKANPEFLHYFFVTQQFARYLTLEDFNNKSTLWFYFPIVLAGFFPWSILILQSLVSYGKKIWQQRQAYPVQLFVLLWFVIIFAFFSVPRSKTIGYILPIFPALALLTGAYLDQIWNKNNSYGLVLARGLYFISTVILGAFFIFAPAIKNLNIQSQFFPYLNFAAIVLFTSAACTLLLARKQVSTFLIILFSTICLLLLTLSSSAKYINQNSIKPLTITLAKYIQPKNEVATYYKYYQDLPLYLQRRITVVADWQSADIPKNDNWVRELWYGMPFQDTKEWLIDETNFWKRWNSSNRMFVFLKNSYLANFSKKTGEFYMIDQYNDVVLVSNQPNHG